MYLNTSYEEIQNGGIIYVGIIYGVNIDIFVPSQLILINVENIFKIYLKYQNYMILYHHECINCMK